MDDDDDDYIFFGTPLPEIEDEATLKKKAAKELQVRDEKGRQRFHGAFTGGFSAGYFNTVGTKEGWAPSTFISSRNKTAERIQQNPEDFMDDEDFGEFGIATRKIHTTTNFQDDSVKNVDKRKFIDTDNVIPGEAPLKGIVQPIRESIGISILKKLGWRPGQGIGPRIKKYGTKVYGCSPFPEAVILEEDDPMALSFTFAPEDAEYFSYKPKDNYFGLGYTGLSKQSVLSASIDPFAPTTTKSWLAKDKRKLKISGQAFGVGAFEDDDDDIYGKDDISQYDFSDLALKGSEDSKTTEVPKLGYTQGILDGFLLALQPPSVKNHYPPPAIPPNFKPVHLKSPINLEIVNPNKSRHALSASDRSLLLGERKFIKTSLNVTDVVEENKKSNFEQMPNLPSSSSRPSLNFRPFPNDLSKQQRYEEYLSLKEKADVTKLVQPASMTEWERQQEVEEFAKASILFKPLSSALSSRFESRSHLSVEHEVMSALEKIKKEKAEIKEIVERKNLVGKRNRKTFEWHPVSLLCKRMNVPNPFPNSGDGGTQSILKAKSVFDHLSLNSPKTENLERNESILPTSSNIRNETERTLKSLPTIIQNQEPNIPSPMEENKDLPFEGKRPPIDFFKDIFENSSDDEEENDKVQVDNEKNEVNYELTNTSKDSLIEKAIDTSTETSISTQDSANKETENKFDQNKGHKNSSAIVKVGFGVFANLDLDALNRRKPTEKPCLSGTSKSNINTEKDTNNVNIQPESDVYGPELPPDYSNTVPNTLTTVSSKKHMKSKSSHKHKHHKNKHKKKRKKSSKRSSSSSDLSEDELDDIPPSLIIEQIKKLQRRKS